jgi:putative tricarboxylic transport membrane protein
VPKIGSGIFFLGLALIVIRESWQVGLGTLTMPGSGFIPFGTGIILSFLALLLIYQDWQKANKPGTIPLRVFLALGCLFVYSMVLDTLGFVVSTFLLVLALFRLGEARRWWVLTGMSIIVTFLAYLIFGRLLQVYFPPGVLGI